MVLLSEDEPGLAGQGRPYEARPHHLATGHREFDLYLSALRLGAKHVAVDSPCDLLVDAESER